MYKKYISQQGGNTKMKRLFLMIFCGFILLGCKNENQSKKNGGEEEDSPEYILNNTSSDYKIELQLQISAKTEKEEAEEAEEESVSYILPESSCLKLSKEDFLALTITVIDGSFAAVDAILCSSNDEEKPCKPNSYDIVHESGLGNFFTTNVSYDKFSLKAQTAKLPLKCTESLNKLELKRE